jgi:hypothetical protein
VIVISIPDWEATPYARKVDFPSGFYSIDAFNEINYAESQAEGTRYVNITPTTRRVRGSSRLLAPDGLHPSAEMYALWVDEIIPEALEVFDESIFGSDKKYCYGEMK